MLLFGGGDALVLCDTLLTSSSKKETDRSSRILVYLLRGVRGVTDFLFTFGVNVAGVDLAEGVGVAIKLLLRQQVTH